jgi:selenide, water dikinase
MHEDERRRDVPPRFTREEMPPNGGCLAKLPGCDLHELLEGAYRDVFGSQPPPHPMCRPENGYAFDFGGQSLIITTDLIPLVGTDPFVSGKIAVIHSLSDLYACGATPLMSMVTLLVQRDHSREVTEAVMAGVLQAAVDEGAPVQGGHTVLAKEAMVGVTAIGTAPAGGALRKTGARLGDRLLLSKPLGVGIIMRAFRLGLAGARQLAAALEVMLISNRAAAESAVRIGVRSTTDITGFGLLGHLTEMLEPGQGAVLTVADIPLVPALADIDVALSPTYWSQGNADYARNRFRLVGKLDRQELHPLFDPQTSGGLLVAAAPPNAETLKQAGFWDIGYVNDGDAVELI